VDDTERARIRSLFARFATGVTVVAARHGPLLAGMTANAIASISIDPPVLMASIAKRAETHRAIVGSHAFAVSVLATDQRATAECFALPITAAKLTGFCGAPWHEAETGSPILEGALAYYDCRLTTTHEAGDHTIFLGDVVAAGYREDAAPLLWYGSEYRELHG
jgi:flavin reductase (DIM6/NTAB) family NADH-FMN oxidoreductase RutF